MQSVIRRLRFLILAGAVAFVQPAPLQAAPLPEASPGEVGLSSERLGRLDAAMQKAVDSGELPGAVVLIARDGQLAYAKSFGWQDREKKIPMSKDSIFRLYSMTKPVVSVAVMILVEEGRLGLQEPVSKYIPEFKNMKVGVESKEADGKTVLMLVDAKRQITVQDLLRHTSGLTYGVLGAPNAIKKMYNDAEIFSQKWVLADFCRALAKLPLQYQPGTTWEYGHSTDVLGRVVEVVSGKTLDVFLAERIFAPLKMVDTAFQVPPDKQHRLAQPMPDVYTGKMPELIIDFSKPQTFFAGGHGLVSTAGDYIRFAQMLANGGELEGARILGPRTVEYMTSNHVGPQIDKGPTFLPGPGYGFGLGFATRIDRGQSEWPGSPGDFFWGGYAGTYFWVDPEEELVPILMVQEPVRRQYYRILFRNLVYQSIVK
jgi:CubicO group peptidase (beta-lactamase class C family)